jgi:hypothetical protein
VGRTAFWVAQRFSAAVHHLHPFILFMAFVGNYQADLDNGSSAPWRVGVIAIAILVTDLAMAVVNNVLGLKIDRLPSTFFNRGRLFVMFARNLAIDFIGPPGTVWIGYCVYFSSLHCLTPPPK